MEKICVGCKKKPVMGRVGLDCMFCVECKEKTLAQANLFRKKFEECKKKCPIPTE